MKHLHPNSEFRFNEILFEHRNKEYGAYVLRNESDRILTKALFVGVSLLAAISVTPLVISAFKTTDVIEKIPTSGPFVIQDVYERPDTPPVKIDPVKPVSPPNVKTYDASEKIPTRDAKETPTEKIPDDAVAGLTNNFKGETAKTDYVPTTPTIGTGPVIKADPPVIVPKEDPNKILGEKDLGEPADFAGGINSFRSKVMSTFDGSGFEGEGDIMKTTLTFVVEVNGTISGIKANGKDANFNSEAIRTIKAISNKGKWIPGKNKKGEAVRSYFSFPISMKFDN